MHDEGLRELRRKRDALAAQLRRLEAVPGIETQRRA